MQIFCVYVSVNSSNYCNTSQAAIINQTQKMSFETYIS